jgi:hypothetical protein
MRSRPAAAVFALAAVAVLAMGRVCAAPKDEIRGAFRNFVVAQNAHDIRAVGQLLSDSPDFLWIASAGVVRGRDAALNRFRELFPGTWRVDPDWSTFQVMMLDVSTAEIFVRASTTAGGPAHSARMSYILVNTPRGWRVLSILPGDVPTN